MVISTTRTRQNIAIIFTLSLFLITVTYALDQESFWPQFHGPNRDNISTEKGLLKKWPKNGPFLLWTAGGLGHGYSSISITDGMIYTAGNIGKHTVIIALNLDGKILWQVENGKAWTGSWPGSRGTPTINGDCLFHQNPHGSLICLNAKTGDIVWQLNVIEKFSSELPRWALSESLLVDRDNLISCPGALKLVWLPSIKKPERLFGKHQAQENWPAMPLRLCLSIRGFELSQH